MSVIELDLDNLEQIKDHVSKAKTYIEDGMGTLRQIYSQMQMESGEIAMYSQWNSAIDEVHSSIKKADQIFQRLDSMELIIKDAIDGYKTHEEDFSRLIRSIVDRMPAIGAGIEAIASKDYPTGLIEGEEISSASLLEKKLTAGVAGVAIANLGAVTTSIHNDYGEIGIDTNKVR